MGLFFSFFPALASGENEYEPQLADPLRESWRWREFPQVKGKGLKCIDEDAEGAIWFGIDNGAMRYDGLEWTQFGDKEGLPATVISFATSREDFYAATRSAIYRLQGERWSKVFPDPAVGDVVIENLISSQDGSLWAATCWGAVQITNPHASGPEKKLTLFATEQVAAFFDSRQHSPFKTVIIGTPDKNAWPSGCGVYVYGPVPRGQSVIALAKDGPAAKAGMKIGDRIVAFQNEPRQTVYQNELDAEPDTQLRVKVQSPDSDETRIVELTSVSEVVGDCETFRPYRMAQSPDGTMWFATRLGKIISLSTSGNGTHQWTHHTDEHSLPNLAVPSISASRYGVAAVARNTRTSAMVQYDGETWQITELQRAIGSSIAYLENGGLIVGTAGAVITIDGQKNQLIQTRQHGISGIDVIVKRTKDNVIWIGGKGAAVLRVEPNGASWTTYEGIIYQDTDQEGCDWFLSNRFTIVKRDLDNWIEFDSADGLMTTPMRLIATSTGDVWAAGSHNGVAATARFENEGWKIKEHPRLAWAIDRRSVFEDRDARLWFGAASGSPIGDAMVGGVVRFDGEQWKHIEPTNRLTYAYGAAQTPDGSVWFGGPNLVQILPNDRFGNLAVVPSKAHGYCDALQTDHNGNLWVGTRSHGLLRMSINPNLKWQYSWFDEESGLSNNRVRGICRMADGTMLANTSEGFDRFDGTNWSTPGFPSTAALQIDVGGIQVSPDGAVWLNSSTLRTISPQKLTSGKTGDSPTTSFRTRRYFPDSQPPVTQLKNSPTAFPVEDDAMFSWTGVDRWNGTESSKLAYSWRIDDNPWSPFTAATSVKIPDLPAGPHRLEVRSRDGDFNVDPNPPFVEFDVTPLLWNRTWFRMLMLFTFAMLCIALAQTARVFRREAALRVTNKQLVVAEKQLKDTNAVLEDRVLERTRELQQTNQQLLKEIQERITAEAKLLESEVRYRSIVEDQTEYIVRFDAKARIEFVNDAFLRATEKHNGQPGIAGTDQLPSAVQNRIKNCITGLNIESPTAFELIRVEHPNGTEGWEEWSGRALFDRDRLIGFQAIGRDITELKKAEARLDEKEQQLAHIARVSALGEMVAGISHEINQPLATIGNFSAASLLLLEQDHVAVENKQNLREWNQQISRQTTRISKIISGLRRFASPGSQLNSFHIGEAVDESLLLTKSRIRSTVDQPTTDISPGLPTITADRIQIEQVLVNLIRNACDAMDSIPRNERRLHIEANSQETVIEITVTDSGPGVAPEDVDNIFANFMTTKLDGMGIGLAISRSIIESHGGELVIVSDAGCGKFRFTLPLIREA